MRLIDADELLSKYQTICSCIRCDGCQFNGAWGDKGCQLEALIKDASTVAAEPIRRGYWKDVYMSEVSGYDPLLSGHDPLYGHCCSVCGEDAYLNDMGEEITSKYCPFCGALLEEDAE